MLSAPPALVFFPAIPGRECADEGHQYSVGTLLAPEIPLSRWHHRLKVCHLDGNPRSELRAGCTAASARILWHSVAGAGSQGPSTPNVVLERAL